MRKLHLSVFLFFSMAEFYLLSLMNFLLLHFMFFYLMFVDLILDNKLFFFFLHLKLMGKSIVSLPRLRRLSLSCMKLSEFVDHIYLRLSVIAVLQISLLAYRYRRLDF